jgi:hypothetical protein
MAVTHTTAARDAAANAVVDLLDAGTPPGFLVFQTSGDATVCTITLETTAFGASSVGVATMAQGSGKVSDEATAGTIAKAKFTNAAGTSVILCAVATTGSDINVPGGLTLANGDKIEITALTYTAPA